MDNRKTQSEAHWFSVVQFLVSSIGAVMLLGSTLIFMIIVVTTGISDVPYIDTTTTLLLATGTFFAGVLLLPSGWYSALHLIGKPKKVGSANPWFLPAILLFPLAVALGEWIIKSSDAPWILLPPIHIMAVGIPILWFLELGRYKLPQFSSQRTWGIFGSGLVLAPLLLMILELAALGLIMGAIVIYVIQRPDMSAELERLIYRLSVAPQSPDIIARILLPALKNRVVILGTLIFGAIIVPLLEELIKPIGVWMLVGQKPTPSQGFVAGLLSGAGYAMFENLALSASAGDAWSMIMLARTGTSLIHIMTTGLMGWSLALAWNQGKHLRLVLTYLGVVLIHGLWNGLVLTFTFASYSFIGGSFPEPIMKVGKVAPYLLVGLVSVAFILLIVENLNLRRAIISPASVDTQSNHISPTNKRSILN
ncbi:MAG TPA: PrsW family intramembrane metalloprotease [Anaerolineae bacterium]|nr:PrsW family intramembrane metalloprotease [Anaerolineae bacterium]